MRTAPTARARSHRAVGIYLGAVVLPTLALLYLGYESVHQQGLALEEKTRHNERLMAERLAADAERRVRELARECFRDPALIDVLATLDEPGRPDADRRIRAVLEGISKRHPLAAAWFVAQGDSVRFPLLESPPHRTMASYLDGETLGERPELLKLLQGAELGDMPGGRPDEARALYRRVLAKARSLPLRALALARLARIAGNTGDAGESARLYGRLFTDYPDEYDPYHRPYALVAALELQQLDAPSRANLSGARPNGESLRQQMASGRWEITPDVAEWFAGELKPVATGPERARLLTPFQRHFKVAEVFAKKLLGHGALRPDLVYPLQVEAIGQEHQLLYSVAPEDARTSSPVIVVALDVDLDWVKATLLPDVARELKVAEPIITPVEPPRPGQPPTAGSSGPAFRTMFQFWQVDPPPTNGAAERNDMMRRRWVFGGATSLVLGLLVMGVVLLARDVSRERRVNQFKADLVAGVSHELKTPLTIIRLYAETLGGSLSLTDDERREYSDIITRESDRLTALIDRVLNFSRLEQSGRTYALVPGDLGATVKLAVDVYGTALHRRGFDLTFEPGDDVAALRFDADAVVEAVINLLDNAAKYSAESRWIGVRLARRASQVVVEVEDRGPGVEPKDRDRIFQEYYRANGSAGGNGSVGGHGLGLYLVQHIMTGHGGSVEVDSEVGRGSTFRLVFPCAEGVGP